MVQLASVILRVSGAHTNIDTKCKISEHPTNVSKSMTVGVGTNALDIIVHLDQTATSVVK